MIVTGGSRSNGRFFAQHLMREDSNARVAVIGIRGLTAATVPDAFREMHAIASGTRTTNHLYHASLNPDPGETLTPEQWEQATDILERHLGFTGQPRVVVEHEKEGRVHRHAVWSRIEADTLTARPDSLTYRKHERASREIERLLGHRAVPSVLVKDRSTPRPPRRPKDWEAFRGQVLAALLPFLRSILRHGALPSILATVIDDGLRWWQRAAQQMATQDAPDAPTGARRRG